MTNGDEPSRSGSDVLIAGAGLAGLTAAFGMAKAGFDVVCCGAAERTGRGRTVALLDQSVAFLEFPRPMGEFATPSRASALIAPHRRHGSVLSAAAGRVPRGGDRARRLRMEYRKRPDGRRARGQGRAEFPASSASRPGIAAYDFSADAVRARLEDGREISARLAIGADGRIVAHWGWDQLSGNCCSGWGLVQAAAASRVTWCPSASSWVMSRLVMRSGSRLR